MQVIVCLRRTWTRICAKERSCMSPAYLHSGLGVSANRDAPPKDHQAATGPKAAASTSRAVGPAHFDGKLQATAELLG